MVPVYDGRIFLLGFLALSSKYLLNIGVPILARLILTMPAVTVLILVEIKVKKINIFHITKPQLVTLNFIGIFGSIYAYFMQVAFNLAPNVGMLTLPTPRQFHY